MQNQKDFTKKLGGHRRTPRSGGIGINEQISAEDLCEIFKWVDGMPFSRPKKNINRDFSDGVLFSEAVYNFFPKLVELHNYAAACSFTHKKSNWDTLNHKVLMKIGFKLTDQHIKDLCQSKLGAIELALKQLYEVVRTDAKIEAAQVAEARGDGNFQKLTPEVICLPSEDLELELTNSDYDKMMTQQQYKSRIQELEKTVRGLKDKVKRQGMLLKLKDAKLCELALENNELHRMKVCFEPKAPGTPGESSRIVEENKPAPKM